MDPGALELLHRGDIAVEGRMPWSSNATFLVEVTFDGTTDRAIYKPHRGEQWLWDFPDGLYVREVAAYELAAALGWDLVPETVIRHDAPAGTGSLQRFVGANYDEHYFTLLDQPAHGAALRRMAVFDVVANNADRKGGHCLLDDDGHLWGIDHGLCFHEEPKLRTVMWDFAGETIDEGLLADLDGLRAAGLPPTLCDLLSAVEIEALQHRLTRVLERPVFPEPTSRRSYPWPMI